MVRRSSLGGHWEQSQETSVPQQERSSPVGSIWQHGHGHIQVGGEAWPGLAARVCQMQAATRGRDTVWSDCPWCQASASLLEREVCAETSLPGAVFLVILKLWH